MTIDGNGLLFGGPSKSRRCMGWLGSKVGREQLDAVKPLLHLMAALFMHVTAYFMVVPALTDVIMEALCPGKKECSEAIYLSSLQQVVSGIGTMLLTPVLGNLSDVYGRKPLLMIPFTFGILPVVVLAYKRTKYFIYIYYGIRTVVAMTTEGSIICLSLAYVADMVEQRLRGPLIGVLMTSFSAGYVTGILIARVLPEEHIFKASVILYGLAALYLKTFLIEEEYKVFPEDDKGEMCQGRRSSRGRLSLIETLSLVKESKLLIQVSIISFFSSLGDAGIQGSLLYYLKATFSFEKDQFAELMLLAGITSVISQLVIMPVLVHLMGEQRVLCIGLLAASLHALLYGIAWASWVPYLAASLGVLSIFVFPSIGSMVSKAAGDTEQGSLQGFMAGVRSFANIIAPFAISPLTALFLSDKAPFPCPGFSIICAGAVMMMAFIQGTFMRIPPTLSRFRTSKFVQVNDEDQFSVSSVH